MGKPQLRVLSLGWGVQSWTAAAMIALGEWLMIDFAIHADTTHEAAHTYAHAKKWTPWLEEVGLKVWKVRADNTDIVRPDWSESIQIPAFTLDTEGQKLGQVRQQCTRHWKIDPIQRFIRERLGTNRPPPGFVKLLQGISLDEASRMSTSRVKYIEHEYPLVDLRMTRRDCMGWLESRGLDVPGKSACTFCPYHNIKAWKTLKRRGGPDWKEAVEVDSIIRDRRQKTASLFSCVHPYRKPLEEAVSIPEDQGAHQMGMFDMVEGAGLCESGFCMT